MAIDHLLATLERDAAAVIDRLGTAARAEAEAIAVESQRRITERRATALAAREADARGAAAASLADVRRKARGQVLAARQRVLDRVFAGARSRLPEAGRGEAYMATLSAELAVALASLGDVASVIRCAAPVAAALERLVADRPACRVEPDAGVDAGFIAATADGAIEVDATLASRLERLRDRLSLEVLRRFEARS
jgi:vacuolar-type H+-ATPase subunit E/Vma4